MEIRSAIVFGTIMVILVFLPLFALSGMEGRLFAPLAMAYIVSILASLLVSLTVTPVLSYYLLKSARATHRQEDSPVLKGLKRVAGKACAAEHGQRRAGSCWPPGLLVLAVLAAAVGSAPIFLPTFDEGSVQVNVVLPGGRSLEASKQVSAVVDAHFRQLLKTADNPHGLILNYVRKTGRAELDEHVDPVTSNEFIMSINPDCGMSPAMRFSRKSCANSRAMRMKHQLPQGPGGT